MALTTFQVAALALAGASTAIGTFGAIQQGQQQKQAYAYQAAVQRQQAERERQIAAVEEAKLRRQQSALLATRRVRLAGAGVDPALGTALLGTEAAEARAEYDALLVRAGGLTRENALLNEATLSGFRGASAARSGLISGGATLLGGLARGAGWAADRFPGGSTIPREDADTFPFF